MNKQVISNKEFGGERPLYRSRDLILDGVTVHAGESSLKECRSIEACNCRFEGKYVFWENDDLYVHDCLFTEGARSSVWYTRGMKMRSCMVQAPKMFREASGIDIEGCQFPNAQETLWHCRGIRIRNTEISNADYLFMYSEDIDIDGYTQKGNYSFQHAKNVVIRNAEIHSKDAFWDCENVTVYDSTIVGEYLGWYSKNLRLVRCHIEETQPLCYCEGLLLEDCTFGADADLAFEYCSVEATLRGDIASIKNPTSGHIRVQGHIGEVILDENIKAPGNCVIESVENQI